MENKRLPVGVDDFAELINGGYYYVDKTGFIKELLEIWGKVNLFTRPRRFGKSINMSMLKYFFEIGTDKSLFDGLEISKEAELCEKYMGRFPVVSISLKQVTGETYEKAEDNIKRIISKEAKRFNFLLESEKLDDDDKDLLKAIGRRKDLVDDSIYNLSYFLSKHYDKKVVILIDEYDAPLQKAYENGYYDSMVKLIRQIFGYALKSNEFLYFGVLTGCMRVSKESIFSDLNNPTLYTLIDDMCDEWFGFTDDEVKKLLNDLGLNEHYSITKDWYDGYRIGVTDIYCPWDVINWCRKLLLSSDNEPENYWTNVSENSIIYRFAEMANSTAKYELEILSQGSTVDKKLSFELTYKDIDSSIDNLWSVLFTTGYLTQRGKNTDGTYKLAIPNKEVKSIFSQQINKWFLNKIESGLKELNNALNIGDAEEIERQINICLRESISFMDGGNSDVQKESFYHGLLLGMLKGCGGWSVVSNREAGNGRADIILTNLAMGKGIIIEVKYSPKFAMLDDKAKTALQQIEDRKYGDYFINCDVDDISKYGIAFSRRGCRVMKK